MQKIVIKATDAKGETMQYIRMTQPIFAEMAFYALTHDASNQDCNWELIVDGETINWHCPLNKQDVRALCHGNARGLTYHQLQPESASVQRHYGPQAHISIKDES